jgi:hypothetical protein
MARHREGDNPDFEILGSRSGLLGCYAVQTGTQLLSTRVVSSRLGSSCLFIKFVNANFGYFEQKAATRKYYKCVLPLLHPTPTMQTLRHKLQLSVQKAVQGTSKLQHTETRSAAA